MAHKIPYTLADWLKEKSSNPHVYARVMIAKSWLEQKFSPRPEDLLSELVCYDFSLPVAVIALEVGTTLVGYKPPAADPLSGRYFAPAGTPLFRSGIGWEALDNGGVPVAKVFHRYRVQTRIPEVLQSTCAPARDTWSRPDLPRGQLSGGGATQYVIPNARAHLVKVP
jgi:Bacterial toxin 46